MLFPISTASIQTNRTTGQHAALEELFHNSHILKILNDPIQVLMRSPRNRFFAENSLPKLLSKFRFFHPLSEKKFLFSGISFEIIRQRKKWIWTKPFEYKNIASVSSEGKKILWPVQKMKKAGS